MKKELINEYVYIVNAIKELEKKKKSISEQMINEADSNGTEVFEGDDMNVRIIRSERRTIDPEKFIITMKKLGDEKAISQYITVKVSETEKYLGRMIIDSISESTFSASLRVVKK